MVMKAIMLFRSIILENILVNPEFRRYQLQHRVISWKEGKKNLHMPNSSKHTEVGSKLLLAWFHSCQTINC